LDEYLTFDFDPDRVLDIPIKSLNIALLANLSRYSRFSCPRDKPRGDIILNLQPAVDVASMTFKYWESQVWPARVVFDLFSLVEEMSLGNGIPAVSGFADQFLEHRLRRLITDSNISKPGPPLKSFFSSRRQMFGSMDKRALTEQLCRFQAFHEIGHFVGFAKASQHGVGFSLEEEENELACDEFACEELNIEYEGSLGIEFLESACVSIFLSILIWTLAEQFPYLDNQDVRTRSFATAIKRARAATSHVSTFAHRGGPPSERHSLDALRYFPIFDTFLQILDTFFKEAANLFDSDVSTADIDAASTPASGSLNEPRWQPVEPWESIWLEEDKREEQRLERIRKYYEGSFGKPTRSRPMLGNG
jgi:hypothetical protein